MRPWHRNVARAILKEPKYYFFDCAQVKGGEGQKLENIVACALRKELDFLEDSRGGDGSLRYLRTKDGRELNFAVEQGGEVTHRIEVNWADSSPAPAFEHVPSLHPDARSIQLVGKFDREKTYPDRLLVADAAKWLAELDLTK